MGGSSTTTGWNYQLAWWDDLCLGPLDAAIEFRGADKVAWKGRLTSSGVIFVNKPKLWGGDKDQGGAVGRLRWQFGEAGQVRNSYLVGVFGDKITARRGIATAVWEGGTWGANNPYQQKRSYRVERIVKGWDDDDCWYPAKAPVPLVEGGIGAQVGSFLLVTGASDGHHGDAVFASAAVDDGPLSFVGLDPATGADLPNAVAGYDDTRKRFVAVSSTGVRYSDDNRQTWQTGSIELLEGDAQIVQDIVLGPSGFLAMTGRGYPANLYIDDGACNFSFIERVDANASWQGLTASARRLFGDGEYYYVNSPYKLTRTANPSNPWQTPFANVYNDGTEIMGWHDAVRKDGALWATATIDIHTEAGQVRWSPNGGETWPDANIVLDVRGPSMVYLKPVELYSTSDHLLAYTAGGRLWTSANNWEAPFDTGLGGPGGGYPYHSDVYGGRHVACVGNLAYVIGSSECVVFDLETLTVSAPVPLPITGARSIVASPPSDPLDGYEGRWAKNPAHMILFAHTQQWAGRQPRASVDLDQLHAAADWYYARGFGLCTRRKRKEESPGEFIRRIEKVAGCSFTLGLDDGLWHLDIANGEYDIDSLPIITDDDVLSFKETKTTLDDAVNSVSIQYFDPERNEKVITPPVRAMGLIAQFGEIHQTLEFPEIPIGYIATMVATRELLARITPGGMLELDVMPWWATLRKNQYVRVQMPKRGIADAVFLVGEVKPGKLKSGAVSLKLGQDIYSLPDTVYGGIELGEDTRPPTEAAPIVHQRVFEAGYIDVVANMPAADFAALPADASYLVGTAVNPGRMRNFTLAVAPDGGYYDDVGDGEFCPSCTSAGLVEPGLQEGIGFNDPVMMASVQLDDLGLWDNELVRVDAIDLDAGTLDLGRGCGHTLPEQHAAGSRIYFYQHSAAYDPTQHIAGETLNAKLLTNSFSEQLDPADATAVDVTVEGLLACPYPPGDYRINGVSIYAVGSATPGGGVGGGTGSGSVPTTPPAYSPDGTPSSSSTGPNGGYPDNGPYPVPPVPDYGDDLIPTVGDFDIEADLNAWRLFGGAALPEEWSISGGYLRYSGAGDSAAYCYPARYSLPLDEIRYSATVRATVQSEPGLPIAVGYAMGFSSSSGGLPVQRNHTPLRDYPVETTIEYATVLSAGSGLSIINLLPILVVGASDVGIANARFTNVEFIVEPVDVPATTQVLDHLAFDSGLTGWTRIPVLDPGDATIGTAGGVLSFEPEAANGTYTHFVCDDPIDLADEIGKVIKISGEVWSNDPTVFAGRTVNGVALGVTSKVGGVYNYNPNLATGYLRGDFTLRRTVSRINTLDPGMTWHLVVSMRAALGYRAKVRNLAVAVTDAVVD